MSHVYRAVGWNRQKRIYDSVMAAGLAVYLGTFVVAGLTWNPNLTAETLVIRALGTAALVLLHLILAIGPLSRLDRRFLPLLYNRRHLGVTMFFLAAGHGLFAVFQFHALGRLNPFVSVLSGNGSFLRAAGFPFQALGLAALCILFLMAATSHDFWLANLGPSWWKQLHLGVYLAYALILMHVALGALQSERQPLLAGLLVTGLVVISGLHLVTGGREAARDREVREAAIEPLAEGWHDLGPVADFPEAEGRTFTLGDERVAVFRFNGRVAALGNVCAHQGGPLGEGRVIEGCVTCPWHGYQFRPQDGVSPPPFTERVPTHDCDVREGRVWVRRSPNPLGAAGAQGTLTDEAGGASGRREAPPSAALETER